jgi:hypothetical protein
LSPRLRSIVIVGLLALATFALYWPAVDASASTVGGDSLLSLVRTHPLFFRIDDGSWRQPIPVYFRAILGDHAPVWMAAVDVVLIYLAALCFLRQRWAPPITAVLLLLFPAHAVFGRSAQDAIYPVPFVLAWLLCLLSFFNRPRHWLMFVGALCLGAGVYTQPSAPITMAAFLIVTLAAAWIEGHRAPGVFAAALAGFAIPLLLMAPWFVLHPESYPDTMGAWAIHKAHLRSPLDGVRAFLNWNTLGARASLYWEIYNPSFLLFRSEAGAFSAKPPMLLALAVLVPLGLKRLLTVNRASIAWLLLTGLATAPLAAATFGERHAIDRALPMVVFLSLLGGLGVAELLESPRTPVRVAAALLLASVPLQYFLA